MGRKYSSHSVGTLLRFHALLQAWFYGEGLELPEKMDELEARIEELKAAQDVPGSDPTLNLPLTKTRDLVTKRQREEQELMRELEALQAKVPRKK